MNIQTVAVTPVIYFSRSYIQFYTRRKRIGIVWLLGGVWRLKGIRKERGKE